MFDVLLLMAVVMVMVLAAATVAHKKSPSSQIEIGPSSGRAATTNSDYHHSD